ncbi:MAG: hypothetical protein CM15mP4_0680 [Candidatus Neomarinimicrobiota bacterium]|nr:MAG: hypothetical protein CM15mP4_0680 [Candidatus Neomarinimicrobiota bacterium]
MPLLGPTTNSAWAASRLKRALLGKILRLFFFFPKPLSDSILACPFHCSLKLNPKPPLPKKGFFENFGFHYLAKQTLKGNKPFRLIIRFVIFFHLTFF